MGKAKGVLEVWEQGDREVEIEKGTHRGSRDIQSGRRGQRERGKKEG